MNSQFQVPIQPLPMKHVKKSEKASIMSLLNSEAINDLRPRMESLIERLSLHPKMLGRYLNDISSGELLGGISILKSFRNAELNETRLSQAHEELKHCRQFRKAAEKLCERPLTFDHRDTLAAASTQLWILRIGAEIKRELARSFSGEELTAMTSLYCGVIIEIRCIWWFSILVERTRAKGLNLTIDTILTEESLHVKDLEEELLKKDPQFVSRSHGFHLLECKIFERYYLASLKKMEADWKS